jgi:hypothetical protein
MVQRVILMRLGQRAGEEVGSEGRRRGIGYSEDLSIKPEKLHFTTLLDEDVRLLKVKRLR